MLIAPNRLAAGGGVHDEVQGSVLLSPPLLLSLYHMGLASVASDIVFNVFELVLWYTSIPPKFPQLTALRCA